MSIAILLLAAGSSQRMRGADKLLQKVNDVPILRLMAERAMATSHPIYVTLPQGPHPRYDALEGLDLVKVPVQDAQQGMGVSLACGISHLPQTVDAVLVLLADMPDLRTSHMLQVINARTAHPDALIWRGGDRDGKAGHPVLLDATLFPQLRKLKGDSGAQSIISDYAAQVYVVEKIGAASRLDLDTPEAWQAWQRTRDR
ncbi:MAG: NTP transferase domain-containing protein [Paracoccaceae bacterium]